MKLLRSFPFLALLLVLLSIIGACLAQGNIPLLVTASVLAVVSWYVTEGPRGRFIPQWVSNVLIIGVSLYAFADVLDNRGDPLGVLGRYLVFIAVIRLYERKSQRSYAHLMALSLLLMIAGCLRSAELYFGVVLLAYAVLGVYVLLLFQLYSAYEGARSERSKRSPSDYRLIGPLKPILGRRPVSEFRLLTAGIGLVAILLSVILFIAMPRRLGDEIETVFRPAVSRQSGFPTEVNLFTGGRVNDSRFKVMNLRLRDEQGDIIRGAPPLYLRGSALEWYDENEGRWYSRSSRNLVTLITLPNEMTWLGESPPETGQTTTVELEVFPNYQTVFSLYAPVGVLLSDEREIELAPSNQTLRLTGRARLEEYQLRVQPSPAQETMRSIIRDDGQSVQSYYNNRRVRGLARDILRNAGIETLRADTDEERWFLVRQAANAFKQYLHTGDFTYTLDLGDVPVGTAGESDPIEQFLFETRRGHCEFFAAALAAMCQSVRIDARVVTGFLVYDYDEQEQQYNVLSSNAHAWVEVRTGPTQWSTFDGTPPAVLRELHDEPSNLADQLRWMYQGFESEWLQSVIEYDASTQGSFASAFEEGWSRRLTEWVTSVRGWASRVNEAFKLGPAGYIWMGIVALALVIAVVALVKLVRRSLAMRRLMRLHHFHGAEYQRMLRQLGFYLDMLLLLERHGEPKPDWQPPLDFARHLNERRPGAAGLVERISRLFYRCRYGYQRLTSQELREARGWVDQLGPALKGAA